MYLEDDWSLISLPGLSDCAGSTRQIWKSYLIFGRPEIGQDFRKVQQRPTQALLPLY